MKRSSRKHSVRFSLLLILSTTTLLLMTACDVDTSAIPPFEATISAVPNWICPGEVVAVSWDAGEHYEGSECSTDGFSLLPGSGTDSPRCTTVELSSSPAGFFSPPVPPHQSIGSQSAAITDSTTFTLNAHVDDYYGSLGPRDATASDTTIIIFDIRTQSFQVEPTCDGATLIRNGEFHLKSIVSGCVRIERICNTSDDGITIEGEGTGEIVLYPGECTAEITGPPPDTLAVGPLFAAYDGNVCGSTATDPLPSPLQVTITFGCDTSLSTCDLSSASMPVISAPEEVTNTPEPVCNLDKTCGDGLCDPACENNDLCSIDCQPTSDQPPDSGAGNQPSNDGSGNQPPNSDGGQATCEKSCGNQTCEPNCGESPNTCPADCP